MSAHVANQATRKLTCPSRKRRIQHTQKPTGNKRYIAIIIIDDKGEMETEDMFSKYMTQYRNHDMAASVVHNHNTVHTLKPQSKSGVFRNRLSIENSNNIAKAVA